MPVRRIDCVPDLVPPGAPGAASSPAVGAPAASAMDGLIAARLTAVVDALFDTAMVLNASAFAGIQRALPVEITPPALPPVLPASAELIFKNLIETPVVVYVRLDTGENGLPGYLYLALDTADNAVPEKADIERYGVVPEATIIVPRNGSLFANASSPDASGDPLILNVTLLPLRGRAAVFRGR